MLVTVSGVVALPVSAWAFGRLTQLPFPTPPLLAVGATVFLFDRSFSIYGGNIASTLAGEFAFSMSLALAILYLGVVGRGLRTGRHRGWAALLLALTGLCHLIPAFFAVGGTIVWFLLWAFRDGIRTRKATAFVPYVVLLVGALAIAAGLVLAIGWLQSWSASVQDRDREVDQALAGVDTQTELHEATQMVDVEPDKGTTRRRAVRSDGPVPAPESAFVVPSELAPLELLPDRPPAAVYQTSDGCFDHVLYPCNRSNVYLVVVVAVREGRVHGHFVLNLADEYGLPPDA